jgi:alanyl aminopeptidase
MYFTDPISLKLILEFTQSDLVASGDSLGPIYFLFYANKSHAPLYDWLEQHFDAVVAKAPDTSRVFLPQLTGASCDAKELERTLAFYKGRDEMFKTALAKAEEDTRNCLSLKDRQQQALASFFSAYRGKDAI